MKVFVYPTGGKTKGNNPYIANLKEALRPYFDVLNPSYKMTIPRMMVLLLNSFKADAYVLNWIEDSAAGRGGFIGKYMSLLSLIILRLRKVKIVWIFHNLNSHGGDTYWNIRFRRFLYKYSSIIVSHSKEAQKYAQQFANCPVLFKNHPVKPIVHNAWEGNVQDCDFFYWGTILPYKGVLEFISKPECVNRDFKILIWGKCNDETLRTKIEEKAVGNIRYENRNASFSEIADQCKKAKYVIFPYVGSSISSSGVLIDTLMMGGTPVGPNRGAFADLAEEGCCITYDVLDEVFTLPIDDKGIRRLDSRKVQDFIMENSWGVFGQWIYKTLTEQNN